MARPGVTYADVDKACKEITSSGGSPTINAVREKLGTGSPNNIAPHIKKWKEINSTESNSILPLPENIAFVITNEMQKAIDAKTAEIKQELETLKDLHAESIKDNDRLNIEITNAQAEASEARIEVQRIMAASHEKDMQIKELKDERDRIESSLKNKIATQDELITSLRQTTEEANIHSAELKVEIEAMRKQVESIPAIEKARETAERAADVAKAREAAAREAAAKLETEIALLSSKLDERHQTISQIQQDLSKTKEQWSDLRVENAILNERLNANPND